MKTKTHAQQLIQTFMEIRYLLYYTPNRAVIIFYYCNMVHVAWNQRAVFF